MTDDKIRIFNHIEIEEKMDSEGCKITTVSFLDEFANPTKYSFKYSKYSSGNPFYDRYNRENARRYELLIKPVLEYYNDHKSDGEFAFCQYLRYFNIIAEGWSVGATILNLYQNESTRQILAMALGENCAHLVSNARRAEEIKRVNLYARFLRDKLQNNGK